MDESQPPFPQVVLTEEELLKKELQERIEKEQREHPPAPEVSSASISARAAAAAKKKLAERRATKRRIPKPQPSPKAKPKTPPPEELPPVIQFDIKGFGAVYTSAVQYLATIWLEKQEFDPAKKTELSKIADNWANARITTIAWLAEFLPEIALIGATVEIIVQTPHATSHHVDTRAPTKREDDTRPGDDGDGSEADNLRSRQPGVPEGFDLPVAR